MDFKKIRKEYIEYKLKNPSIAEKGKANINWKGGISEYPNHCLMKKNRLIKLRQTKGRCKICNKKANYIHHLDYSKTNHCLNNLIIVCAKCHHNTFHKDKMGRPKGSKNRIKNSL